VREARTCHAEMYKHTQINTIYIIDIQSKQFTMEAQKFKM